MNRNLKAKTAANEVFGLLSMIQDPEQCEARLKELRDASDRYDELVGIHKTLESAEKQLAEAKEANNAAQAKLDASNDEALQIVADAQAKANDLAAEAEALNAEAHADKEATETTRAQFMGDCAQKERDLAEREAACSDREVAAKANLEEANRLLTVWKGKADQVRAIVNG